MNSNNIERILGVVPTNLSNIESYAANRYEEAYQTFNKKLVCSDLRNARYETDCHCDDDKYVQTKIRFNKEKLPYIFDSNVSLKKNVKKINHSRFERAPSETQFLQKVLYASEQPPDFKLTNNNVIESLSRPYFSSVGRNCRTSNSSINNDTSKWSSCESTIATYKNNIKTGYNSVEGNSIATTTKKKHNQPGECMFNSTFISPRVDLDLAQALWEVSSIESDETECHYEDGHEVEFVTNEQNGSDERMFILEQFSLSLCQQQPRHQQQHFQNHQRYQQHNEQHHQQFFNSSLHFFQQQQLQNYSSDDYRQVSQIDPEIQLYRTMSRKPCFDTVNDSRSREEIKTKNNYLDNDLNINKNQNLYRVRSKTSENSPKLTKKNILLIEDSENPIHKISNAYKIVDNTPSLNCLKSNKNTNNNNFNNVNNSKIINHISNKVDNTKDTSIHTNIASNQLNVRTKKVSKKIQFICKFFQIG
ncbi:hypothetical protein HELRODRAFT_177843 [Helobdella robusta]|uniref:Uncharacterized protein n=1 Tax=Helobdella robusta TaxID=6412 RepID=T1FCC9_HELRO|nr:hypothetical protein HELRODRAFT_177843 [Helobdella robusta]ESN97780.1 hypothetical protein HELRODRAFT_177843 [Helobdella robusta]